MKTTGIFQHFGFCLHRGPAAIHENEPPICRGLTASSLCVTEGTAYDCIALFRLLARGALIEVLNCPGSGWVIDCPSVYRA